jgi:hypothetical protein
VSTGEGGEGNGRGSGSRSTLSGPVQSTREVFRGNRVGGLRMPVATHRTRASLGKEGARNDLSSEGFARDGREQWGIFGTLCP